MTRSLQWTVLFCLLTSAAFAADKKPSAKEPDPLEQLTKGRGQYAFPSGASLRFARTKDGAVVLSSGDRELYRIPRTSTVGHTLQSPDRRTVLLLLTEVTPLDTPKDSEVTMSLVGSSGILRIHSERKDRILCTMHMQDAQIPPPLQAMNIFRLDSVLNDGFTVQMEIMRTFEDPEEHPSDTVEEVWDLQTHQRLKLYDPDAPSK